MSLVEGDSQVDKVVNKARELIKDEILTVRNVFYIALLTFFFLTESLLQLTKACLEYILLLVIDTSSRLIGLLKLLPALEVF